jgi:carbonic anhydrase
MDIPKIFENNSKWVSDKLSTDPNYFKNLSKGQDPQILYIGCSDSRVNATDVLGVDPGEAFIHRNIANMVINTDLSAMSVIHYAISVLNVQHVIVCGHYGCGGVKAAMESKDLGILNPWLRNIRDVGRLHKEELNAIDNEEEKYKRLVELNVQEQCVNVIKTSEFQIAFKTRGITMHGWVFDLSTGKLVDLNIDFKKVLEGVMEFYRLD